MLPRFAIAVIGGAAITAVMLLMMSEFAASFRERDTMRYFRITDVIPATGTRRPEPPRAPALPPPRPRAQYERGPDRPLGTERPGVDQPIVIEPSGEPSLDPSLVTPDDER